MPYGMTTDEFVDRLGTEIEATEQHINFAEKFNVDIDELKRLIRFPHFINTNYEFRSVADILDLEFTKMLEQDIRFRKCKLCGKYFIMKGNYNTNYCDRIAEGETRNCQDIMHLKTTKRKWRTTPPLRFTTNIIKDIPPELRLILSLRMILRSGNMRL